MPAARPSQAVITNAIRAAETCGIAIGVIEITRDGAVRIVAAKPESVDESEKPAQPARPKQWAR